MNAFRIILSHFSQRYSTVSTLPPDHPQTPNAFCAFDFMRIRFRDLVWAPQMVAVVQSAFPEVAECDEGSSDNEDISDTI